jgi:hypothetical protein
MAFANGRIWVSGGDWLHSATDGTWSMDLSDGSWEEDIGAPVYPTLPAPHALQDGAGFAWSPQRSRFLMWPGVYFAYEAPDAPIREYAKGMWWLDPAQKAYTQELGLFGDAGSWTGCVFGGIYDEVNDQLLVFGDSSGVFEVDRWDVTNLVKLPSLPFTLVKDPSLPAAYFTRTMPIKIDRAVYILGYRTDGTQPSQKPLFLRWQLDAQTMEELPAPPVDGPSLRDIEIRIGTSHGRVVWPLTTGPDGEIHGIHIYDPASATWYLDDQVPSYGTFIGNAVTSLPDGRVVWSGGEFGRQQTHIWFYEAM